MSKKYERPSEIKVPEESVIYYGEYYAWYTCASCHFPYGKKNPIGTHWEQPCPNCALPTIFGGPNTNLWSRRYVCIYKPKWIAKILGEEEIGNYEHIFVNNDDSKGGGGGQPGVARLKPFMNTAIIGAASLTI